MNINSLNRLAQKQAYLYSINAISLKEIITLRSVTSNSYYTFYLLTFLSFLTEEQRNGLRLSVLDDCLTMSCNKGDTNVVCYSKVGSKCTCLCKGQGGNIA
jgi:hypothetical protein